MTYKRAAITILVILAVGNGVWALTSGRAAPWLAVVAYGVVAFLLGRRDDYRAGLIIGIVGFAVHIVELVFQGMAGLGAVERAWLVANIVLPLALVWLSWVLIRRSRAPE